MSVIVSVQLARLVFRVDLFSCLNWNYLDLITSNSQLYNDEEREDAHPHA